MDDRISRALQSLPRTEARPGFTDAVRRRLAERRVHGHRHPAHWPVRLAVAAACLLLLVLGTREWWHHHRRQQTTARLAALENEHRALVSELESLRRQMNRARPVVYLGGNNELDLVLDLAELQRAGFRPSAFRTDRPPMSEVRPPWAQRAGAGWPAPRVAGPGRPDPRPAHFEVPRRPTIY